MDDNKMACPGEVIKRLLKKFHYTQKDLAEKLEINLKTMNEILNGKAPITFDTAISLEYIFNIDAEYWVNLELEYRKMLKLIEEQECINSDYENIKMLYSELVTRKLVSATDNKNEMVMNFRNFMEIIRFDEIMKNCYQLDLLDVGDKCRYAKILIWAQIGLKKAREINTNEFDKEICLGKISEIINLRNLKALNAVKKELKRISSECGIILNIEKELSNISIKGYCRWLTPEKPFIQIVDTKDINVLLYNFMFDLAHILVGKKKMIYYDFVESNLIENMDKEDKRLIRIMENIKPEKLVVNWVESNM